MGHAIGNLLIFLLDVCFWIITFEVINIRNQQAANFVRLIDRITAPVYTPLRKVIPPIAGIDLTPIIVIFAIYLLKSVVASIFFH